MMEPTQGGSTVTQAHEVRAWAREQGYSVGVKGVIAPEIWDKYAAEHPGFQREAPKGEWNCRHCGREWTGKRECHCTACHRHFSTVDGFDAHRRERRGLVICIDPLTSRARNGDPIRAKESMWGTIYVRDTEWSGPQIALGDESDQP